MLRCEKWGTGGGVTPAFAFVLRDGSLCLVLSGSQGSTFREAKNFPSSIIGIFHIAYFTLSLCPLPAWSTAVYLGLYPIQSSVF